MPWLHKLCLCRLQWLEETGDAISVARPFWKILIGSTGSLLALYLLEAMEVIKYG